jgi:hypothetical protein
VGSRVERGFKGLWVHGFKGTGVGSRAHGFMGLRVQEWVQGLSVGSRVYGFMGLRVQAWVQGLMG